MASDSFRCSKLGNCTITETQCGARHLRVVNQCYAGGGVDPDITHPEVCAACDTGAENARKHHAERAASVRYLKSGSARLWPWTDIRPGDVIDGWYVTEKHFRYEGKPFVYIERDGERRDVTLRALRRWKSKSVQALAEAAE